MTTRYAHTNLIARDWRRLAEHPHVAPNTPGFSHIAFVVDDVPATAQPVLDHGGSRTGEIAIREAPGAGLLSFQYMADPEGNIIEIQNWRDADP